MDIMHQLKYPGQPSVSSHKNHRLEPRPCEVNTTLTTIARMELKGVKYCSLNRWYFKSFTLKSSTKCFCCVAQSQ